MSKIKRKAAAGDLTLPRIQANQAKEAFVQCNWGQEQSEDGAEASLSSAVYSVELQSTSKAIIDQQQPFTYMHSRTNNPGVGGDYFESNILI